MMEAQPRSATYAGGAPGKATAALRSKGGSCETPSRHRSRDATLAGPHEIARASRCFRVHKAPWRRAKVETHKEGIADQIIGE